MSADTWLTDFYEVTKKRAEQLASAELNLGELEATLMLIGSRVMMLFPGDIKEGDKVPDVVIRLLEELHARRKS